MVEIKSMNNNNDIASLVNNILLRSNMYVLQCTWIMNEDKIVSKRSLLNLSYLSLCMFYITVICFGHLLKRDALN